MKRIFILALLTVSFQFALATDYYVSTSGNDASGNGSSTSPWRTLKFAVTRVAANQGHIIRLSAGTFVENGQFNVPPGVSVEGAGVDVTYIKAASSFYFNPSDPGFAIDKFLMTLSSGSKKVVSVGVPNSVIFDYDATKYEGDSVIIQQSWDTKLRTNVPKDQHQHTSIYYFPEYYRAKLIVGNQVVKEHELFIKSDGWLTAVNTSPVPVYFKKEDVLVEGRLSLSIEKIKEKNINLQPEVRAAIYGNVNDFGEIYTDDFVFETSVRNEYEEGSSVCQKTNIYLLADRAPTGIPICEKGCISDIDFYFAGDHLSGKKKDLSAFGNNFNDFVKVRIETKNGAGKIFLDDKLVHEATTSKHEKIIGIYFMFEGTGSVDYVRLASSDGLARFEDEF